MDLGLAGKVAIVTGASRGIGRGIAASLLAEGATVAICGRDAGRLETAVDVLGPSPRLLAMVCDVNDPKAIAAFVETVLERFGRIDILVNNAGTHVRADADATADVQIQNHVHEKVLGFYRMVTAVLPSMRLQGEGRIVNIVGQAGRHPHPDRLPSGTTNGALLSMSKSLADGLARENIRVNVVAPQYIASDLLMSLVQKEMRDRNVDEATATSGFTRATSLGRLGTPEEVGDVVAFVVSDRATYITGSNISVDGGYHRYVVG